MSGYGPDEYLFPAARELEEKAPYHPYNDPNSTVVDITPSSALRARMVSMAEEINFPGLERKPNDGRPYEVYLGQALNTVSSYALKDPGLLSKIQTRQSFQKPQVGPPSGNPLPLDKQLLARSDNGNHHSPRLVN